MSKPQPLPTRPDPGDTPGTPEVEAKLRRRLETFDEDAKAVRPWQDVLGDLKGRRPGRSRLVDAAHSRQQADIS